MSLDGVVKDGFNGFRYNCFGEFAYNLDKILADDKFKKDLEENARDYALENFSVESFGKSCEDLYETAISEYDYESSFIYKRL